MKYYVWLLFCLSLISCDNTRLVEVNQDFNNRMWPIEPVLSFDFEIADDSIQYRTFLNLRNSMDYGNSNIYINYSLSSGETVLADSLVHLDLFQIKTGHPYGSGIGDIFDHQRLVFDNLSLAKGTYSIKMQHYMRVDSLSEILSAGVRVEKIIKTESK